MLIKLLPSKHYHIVIYIFFALFLYTGLNIFKDYGISWDEGISRNNGAIALNYIINGDKSLFNYKDKDYGPAFEILLFGIERGFNLTDNPRQAYLMRHLATFLLFFLGVIFFYLLCKNRFKSWKMGLLGSLFLILSPRIFADSFYNSKDIAYLSLFIISIYTLIRYLDKKTLSRALVHALTSALLIDIRIAGVIIIFLTSILTIAEMFVSPAAKERKRFLSLLAYLFFTVLLIILFWPTLWRDPLINFKEALMNIFHFRWSGTVLYLGNYIKASALPWHYIPVWVIITSPLTYIASFFIGYLLTIKSLLLNPRLFFSNRRDDLIFFVWISLPMLIVLIIRPVLYDAWRQMFFIYPALLLFSLIGLEFLFKPVKSDFYGVSSRIIIVILVALITINLANVLKFMAKYHPYQNVYFNILAGKDMEEIKNNFELDYWGLSYRKALEYILKHDPDKDIKICVANHPGRLNANILEPDDRKRLVYVKDINKAKYFLSNYRWHKEEYPYKNEFFAVKVNGAKIMVVYRLD